MLTNLAAIAAAACIAFLITPFVKRLARRLDIIDKPDRKRKRHRRLVPLWGGLSIAIALVSSILICLIWFPEFQTILNYKNGYLLRRLPWVGLSYIIITVFGLMDDKQPLPPKVKLLVQLIAVLIIVGSDFYLKAIMVPGSNKLITLWPLLGMAGTVFWMLFIINAFNFIDGVDGLATSQTIIIGLGLTVCGLVIGHQTQSLLAGYQSKFGSIIASAGVGAALGFYRYNRWPAQLFLGDAGSTLLGFSLCFAGLLIVGQAPTVGAPWAVCLILGWPILDTIQVIIRRWTKGEPISKADNRHLHHELQKQGFTKTATVAFISAISIILSVMGIGLLWL